MDEKSDHIIKRLIEVYDQAIDWHLHQAKETNNEKHFTIVGIYTARKRELEGGHE